MSNPPPSPSSTPTQSASSVPSSSQSSSGSNGQTTLYLFTFLATLFLLLFVSAAIVLRSFILRRRFRRRIEEALAAGLLLTPPTPGAPSLLRQKLERPTFWEALLTPAHNNGWISIMPVSMNVITLTEQPPPVSSSPPVDQWGSSSGSLFAVVRRSLFNRPSAPIPDFSSPDPAAPPTAPSRPNPDDLLSHTSELHVALLIAMPNPHRPTYVVGDAPHSSTLKGKERSSGYWDEEEEGVPDVVLGVAQVACRANGSEQ